MRQKILSDPNDLPFCFTQAEVRLQIEDAEYECLKK